MARLSAPDALTRYLTWAPGLIDPHTHPVLGDYTPRQGTTGWISSYLHGGVTTLICATMQVEAVRLLAECQ